MMEERAAFAEEFARSLDRYPTIGSFWDLVSEEGVGVYPFIVLVYGDIEFFARHAEPDFMGYGTFIEVQGRTRVPPSSEPDLNALIGERMEAFCDDFRSDEEVGRAECFVLGGTDSSDISAFSRSVMPGSRYETVDDTGFRWLSLNRARKDYIALHAEQDTCRSAELGPDRDACRAAYRAEQAEIARRAEAAEREREEAAARERAEREAREQAERERQQALTSEWATLASLRESDRPEYFRILRSGRLRPVVATRLFEQLPEDGVEASLLLGLGADIRRVRHGDPVLWASLLHRWDVVAVLVEAGAEVNSGSQGNTALRNAALYCRPDIVEQLLAAGADPHSALTTTGMEGRAALHAAVLASEDPVRPDGSTSECAEAEQVRVIQLLLDAGADPNAVSSAGTPYDLAEEYGNRAILDSFTEYELYEQARDSADAGLLRRYLAEYPTGRFASAANELLAALQFSGRPSEAPDSEGSEVVPQAAQMVRPQLVNRDEVVEAISSRYPPNLRDAGIGGSAKVQMYIYESGNTLRAVVAESSGHAALDRIALQIAYDARFSPARNRGTVTPVWVSLPITFESR